MKDIYILAIESSCDETSVAIIKNGHDEISCVVLSQMDIHALYGGVVPEIASRNHVENITLVIEECLKKSGLSMDDMDAIAVTYGPGLIGSLLIGVEAAKTLSFVYNKPLIPVHHIAGHIYANNLEKSMEFPLMALVISGGHTELVYMEKDYSFEKIGGTLDDAVGEAYDKVARVLDLPYPGGPKVDKLAFEGKDTYNLPYPLDDNSYNFSFSGLKSSVLNYLNKCEMKGEEVNRADIAASFQKAVVDVLVEHTMQAAADFGMKKVAIAGGVASNGALRTAMEKACTDRGYKFYRPSPIFCTDNAAMIGVAAYYEYIRGTRHSWDLNAVPNLKLGER